MIERELDSLGRVVIPIQYRKKLSLSATSKVSFELRGNKIIITPVERLCSLCSEKLDNDSDINLCEACILRVKSY